MINNIIEGFEFEKTGVECLCESVNSLYSVYEKSINIINDPKIEIHTKCE